MKAQSSKLKAQNNKNSTLINFFFEAATLKRLQRTGWQILGGGRESIAEHSFMVAVISFVIAKEEKADLEKVLLMALFHDFIETRTGDIYKLSDLYVKADEEKAVKDAFSGLFFEKSLTEILKEYEEEKTLAAKVVHDADSLALCIELKQLMENGNQNAEEWYDANLEKLKLAKAKQLGDQLSSTNSQDWWKKERDKIHRNYKK